MLDCVSLLRLHALLISVSFMSISRSATLQVVGIFAWGFFLSFLLRTVNAGIAGDLSTELVLNSSQLGSLSSAYFLGFVLMQLPLGILLDRFGARRVQAALLLIGAAACWSFALSHSYSGLWVSRALMGVGTAGALMSALKAFRFWYAPERQQVLAAIMLVAGTGGALFATVPVRLAVNELGWRSVFGWAGVSLFLAAALLAVLVPRDEERACNKGKVYAAASRGSLQTYRRIFTDGYFWRFGLVSMLTHGGIGAMQSLWLGPWLTTVYGLTPDQAAEKLLYFNLAMLLGYIGQIWVVRTTPLSRVPMPVLVVTAALVVVATQVGLVVWSSPGAWVLWLLLAVATTCFTMILPHISLSFPPGMTGRAYVAYNILIFAGNWLIQFGFGIAIQGAESYLSLATASAFRFAMLVWASLQCIGVLWLLISRAKPCWASERQLAR